MKGQQVKQFTDIKNFKEEFKILDKRQSKLLTDTIKLPYITDYILTVSTNNNFNCMGRKEYYISCNYNTYRIKNKNIRHLLKDFSTNEEVLKVGLCFRK